MKINKTIGNQFAAIFSALIISSLSTCIAHSVNHEIELPKQAYKIKEIHPDKDQYEVDFVIDAANFSYKYVDMIRGNLLSDNYELCKKSAISKWQLSPIVNSGNVFWIIEMYSSVDKKKYAVLNVEQKVGATNNMVRQIFSVSFTNYNSKISIPSNIGEFCE